MLIGARIRCRSARKLIYSATIWMRARIASPELFLLSDSLPHWKCSPSKGIGDSRNEDGKHGDT